MSDTKLPWGDAAFAPRRVALVGASGEAGKAGKLLMDNLAAHGTREIVPVHPSAGEIMGLKAYPTLAAAPRGIDLAVVVTPAHTTPKVIADCAAAGVPVALILSGGFAETGAEGAALEVELKRAARAGGVRVIGPNCFGLIDVPNAINASLAMGLPAKGGVSLFTQSGSYGMAAFSRSSCCHAVTAFANPSSENGAPIADSSAARNATPSNAAAASALYAFIALRWTNWRFTAKSGASS